MTFIYKFLILTNAYILFVQRDFLLKPELLRAISDLGFEHPSEGLCSPILIGTMF